MKYCFSKMSAKNQTVIPREVRAELGLQPGDTLRYRFTAQRIFIEKAACTEAGGPFATFTEWSSEAAEKAYADL